MFERQTSERRKRFALTEECGTVYYLVDGEVHAEDNQRTRQGLTTLRQTSADSGHDHKTGHFPL